MSPYRLPIPPQIVEDPERAVLAVLDITLEVAVNALIAAHMELCDDDFPNRASPAARSADRLLGVIRKVHSALAEYQYVLLTACRDPAKEDGK